MGRVCYNTNAMGPMTMDWFRERGLTQMSTITVEETHRAETARYEGHTFEVDEIKTHYVGGRIDIRDYRCEGYTGWHEYGLDIMHGEDWNALSDWLDNLKTKERVPFDELICMFEDQYGQKIRWADQIFQSN